MVAVGCERGWWGKEEAAERLGGGSRTSRALYEAALSHLLDPQAVAFAAGQGAAGGGDTHVDAARTTGWQWRRRKQGGGTAAAKRV